MDYRTFGNTSLRVSEIGLGCSRLGGPFGYGSDNEVLATLLEAFDRGINFYDTADIYAQGRSEQLLGKAFKSKRPTVVIATKAGYHLTAAGMGTRLRACVSPAIRLVAGVNKYVQRTWAAKRDQSFSPEYLMKSIERSLRRLQTDYLDVFQLHSPPSEVIETGAFIETLEKARSEGKIRWYGVSCLTIDDAKLCLGHPGISTIQVPVNLLEFEGVSSFLSSAERKNVAVIARQALASGLLARPAADLRSKPVSANGDMIRKKLERAKAFQFLELANRRTIAQAALEFVLRLHGVSVVIAGISTRKHLNENLAAPECPLTQDEMAQIYSAFGQQSVQ